MKLKFTSHFFLWFMLIMPQFLLAEADDVYHEATINNPGCGANNYRSVVTPTSAQSMALAWNVEYQFYTTNTYLYYTTDGSTPSGANGVGTGTTLVINGAYSCNFGSPIVDVATATIPAQPAGTTVKYIISAVHSGGGNEIWANGCGNCGSPNNTAALATVFNYTVTASASNVDVYSTGGTATYAGYSTLKAAFDAINLGVLHTGAINIRINANTTETATASLNANLAPASYTSINIKPTVAVTVSGSIAGAIVKLNGADNVTIDGRINGSGRNLTIQNTSTSSATAAVWLASVAVGNGVTASTVRNCELLCGVAQNTATFPTFGIIMCGTTISVSSNGTDNDNNAFIANRIIRCRYGIVTRGTTTNLNENVQVLDNIVGPTSFGTDEIGKVGIFMQADNNSIVRGNTVQYVGGNFTNTTGGADRVGIAIGGESWSTAPSTLTSTNYSVTNNLIHDVIEERTFSALGLLLATTNSGSATNNVVANNFIYNVKANGTGGDQAVGLGIAGGHSDKVVYNSIRMEGDVDPNSSASATSNFGSGIRIANVNGTTHLNLTLRNNVVYMDLFSSSASTVRYYAISGNSAAYTFGTGGENYNDYYINPANTQCMTGGLGSTAAVTLSTQFATLANWQAAYTAAQDANSVQVDPGFTSATDLHLSSAMGGINDIGTPIAGITTDYDGETRSVTTPEMGADEAIACTSVAGGTIAPATQTKCSGATASMSVSGATLGIGISYQWEVSTTSGSGFGDVTGGTGATTTSYTTGALAAGTYYYRLKVTCTPSSTIGYSNELTLTVNPTPTATASSNAPICAGSDINLTVTTDVGTGFTWSGPLTYTSTSQNPTIAAATVAHSGIYAVQVYTATCSATVATTPVLVNPAPSAVTATTSANTVCAGSTVNLGTTGGVTTGAIAFTENFNAALSGWTLANTGTGGTVAAADWTLRASGYIYSIVFITPDVSGFYLSNSDAQESGSTTNTTMTSPAFSTVGYTGLSIALSHYFRYSASPDSAKVLLSLDGTNWTRVQSYVSTQGTPSVFTNATITVPPAFENQATVYLQFQYKAPWGYYWAINNATVLGSRTGPTYAWASTPAGFTSASATPTATPTVSTTYNVTVTNGTNCSASNSVAVTVNQPTTAMERDTACVTYTWSKNSTAYTASGTYIATSTNAAGCVHTDTLHLVINQPTTAMERDTACVTYTWAKNSTAYTASGTYIATSTNLAGCVHTDTLHLVINQPTTAMERDTACVTYTWAKNSTAYTASGTYIATSTNLAGCVHTDTLHLVINQPTTAMERDTACVTYTWAKNSTAYTASGTYIATSTNAAGCVHTDTLHLVINPLPIVSITGLNATYCSNASVVTLAGSPSGGSFMVNASAATTFNPATALASNTIDYTYTDANGCSATASQSVTITSHSTVTLAQTGGITSGTGVTTLTQACAGTPIKLKATTAGPGLNGTNPYQWQRNGVDIMGQTADSIVVTSGWGVYRVRINNVNNCLTNADTFSISFRSLPNVQAGTDKNICTGNSVTLGTTNNASYTYSWFPTTGLLSATISNPVVTATTGSTTYTVYVSQAVANSGGLVCSKSDAVVVNTLTPPAAPTISITAPVPASSTICEGSGVITLSASGTAGATHLQWLKNGGQVTLTTNLSGVVSISNTSGIAANYTAKVKGTNGCFSPASNVVSATIKQAAAPTITPAGTSNIILVCFGANTSASELLTASVTSGTPSYSWYQTGLAGFIGTLNTYNAVISNTTTSRTFNVKANYANGCIRSSVNKVVRKNTTCREDMTVVEEVALAEEMIAYPNPTSDKLKVTINNSAAFSGKLTLSNALGQIVMSQNIDLTEGNAMETLDMSKLPQGVYNLTFDTETTHQVVKVV
ncbi:MAG: T9SS type A sorting domain-containing protein, partial [Bacteroidia bacterium]